MKWVTGQGVKIEQNHRRTLRAQLTELPATGRLILPVCPEAQAELWQTAEVGTHVPPFAPIATCAANGKTVCTPVGAVVEAHQTIELPKKGLWHSVTLTVQPRETEKAHALNRPSAQRFGQVQILNAVNKLNVIDETDGLPLADKLRHWAQEGIDVLACDAVCDDPYNCDNLCALVENIDEITDGLQLAAEAVACTQTRVVTYRLVEAGLREARLVQDQLQEQLLDVTGKYPIWPSLLHQKPFAGKRVGRIGAQACMRLRQAVRLQRPPERCVITVSGSAVREPQNFSVTIGTPLADVLTHCDTSQEGYRLVAIRSAFNGIAVSNPEQVPVLQDTRCVLAMTEPPKPARSCINCGRCSEVCASDVFPCYVLHALERGERNRADFYGLQRCIGCNACGAVCPASIPIAHRIRKFVREGREMDLWRNRSE